MKFISAFLLSKEVSKGDKTILFKYYTTTKKQIT